MSCVVLTRLKHKTSFSSLKVVQEHDKTNHSITQVETHFVLDALNRHWQVVYESSNIHLVLSSPMVEKACIVDKQWPGQRPAAGIVFLHPTFWNLFDIN